MVDSARSENQDKTKQKRALAISFDKFAGFQRQNDRLQLGWIVFSSVPSDLEGRFNQAVQEIESLRAEVSRLSIDNERLQVLMERVSSGVR